MINSAPYWWVECDATGCDNRCPDEGHEITAWSGVSGAIASAEESEWRRDPDGKWFCDEHPRCETCSEPIDDPALAWVEGVAYHRACNDSNATLFRRREAALPPLGFADDPPTPTIRETLQDIRDAITGRREAATHLLDDCPCPNPNHGTDETEQQ